MSTPTTATTDPDRLLVKRAQAGDAGAFAELFMRHRAAARWVAERWVVSAADAEDLVAESFTRVLRALPRLDTERIDFRSYLLACVRNAARDRGRKRPLHLTPEPPETPAADTLDEASAGCEAELMVAALQALPARWRTMVWLTAVEGLTVAEVSAQTGCSPGVVSAVAYRARKRLRKAYLAAHVAAGSHDGCPACRGGDRCSVA